jgi:hypothetical protein
MSTLSPLGRALNAFIKRLGLEAHVMAVLSNGLAVMIENTWTDSADGANDVPAHEQERRRFLREAPKVLAPGSSSDDPWAHVDRAVNHHFILTLHSQVESLLFEVLREHLASDAALIGSKLVGDVQISLRDFTRMTEEERLDHLTEEILHELQKGGKRGVSRLTSVFEFLGFSFPIEQRWRDSFYELQVLRNLIAHRGGEVDRQAIRDWPELSEQFGRPVEIGGEQIDRFQKIILEYLSEVAKCGTLKWPHDKSLPGFCAFAANWLACEPYPGCKAQNPPAN